MNDNFKSMLKDLTPPFLAGCYKRMAKSGNYFEGPYLSWKDALKHSQSYDSDVILEKVKNAQFKVISGEAVYERDSVLFDNTRHSFPVLAGLLRAACVNEGRLSVLDFGGSLGSSYYQCRDFLPKLKSLKWNIVEQPKFVECGKKNFETEELKFYLDINECLNFESPDVVLLSSVLPYIECPYDLLNDIITRGFKYIVLDRTPVTELGSDILTVQHVPKKIYQASYPAWFLSERKILKCFKSRYKILSDFDSFEIWRFGLKKIQNKGYIFVNI